jgi:hypothetical protein
MVLAEQRYVLSAISFSLAGHARPDLDVNVRP